MKSPLALLERRGSNSRPATNTLKVSAARYGVRWLTSVEAPSVKWPPILGRAASALPGPDIAQALAISSGPAARVAKPAVLPMRRRNSRLDRSLPKPAEGKDPFLGPLISRLQRAPLGRRCLPPAKPAR